MLPGDPLTMTFRRRTAAGVPASGLSLSDFVIVALLDGVVVSITPTLSAPTTVGTWQVYVLSFNSPGSPGLFTVYVEPATGTDQIADGSFGGEIDAIDLSTIYGVIAAPIVSVVNSGGPQGDIALRLVQYDYAPITFTVQDQAGNPIDLSGWTDWEFGVREQDQDPTSAFLLAAGITGSAGGLITIPIAKDSSFYDLLHAGVGQIQLYHSLDGQDAGDAAKRRTVARGVITVVRQETEDAPA